MPMTPDEFERRMEELSNITDTEDRHVEMDNLMCELLSSLGYDKGVDIFNDTYMWYA